jgi:hypothetical protein
MYPVAASAPRKRPGLLGRGRHRDELEKPVQAEDDERKTEKNTSNSNTFEGSFHGHFLSRSSMALEKMLRHGHHA